jgi:chromosome segregation ATPase
MVQASSPSRPSALDSGDSALATVRLEVRSGLGRATVYEVGDGGFLIGSVPGCDLRLPGSNLPPIICVIGRGGAAASLRRLAPVMPILVNGKAVATAYLNDGDTIAIGTIEIGLTVRPGKGAAAERAPAHSDVAEREWKLKEQRDQLESDRALWARRREEIEAECRQRTESLQQVVQRLQQQEEELAAARAELEERERTWNAEHETLQARQREIETRDEETRKQNEEGAAVRRELTEIRQQLYQRYHERRERLIKQQQAIHKAARRLQQRKQRIDAGEADLAARRLEWEQKQIEIEGRGEQVERERQLLEEQHRLIVSRQQEVQRDLSERFKEVQARESKLIEAEAALEKGQKQHQADLVRLDRIQATLDQRQKQLQATALEVDHRYEQLQRDMRELEEQAAQLDEWHNRVVSETEELAKRKKEQEEQGGQLDQRAAALEGQQAMLATLRTRLERMREELRRQEQALSDQRVLQEATESDLRTRQAETEKIRVEVDNDRQLHAEERRRFEERRTTLEAAVAQLRQARETLDGEEKQLRAEQEQVRTMAAEQAEQAALLTARGNQLEQEQEKLKSDRQALQEREMTLVRAEQALAALQEQVRRRVEELNEKQRVQAEEEQRLQAEAARLNEHAKNLEQDKQLAETRLNMARQELGGRAAELDEQARKLVDAEEKHRVEQQRIEEAHASLGGQRQVLASERIAFEVERQKAQDGAARLRAELEASRQEVVELGRHLPELEARASSALDRLTKAREQLREHLSEIHGYVRQSRGDLEIVRRDFQAEIERVRQQELDLHVARDEHRLAVAAFRQQLIEWQGRLADLKQSLHLDETRLERRASEVNEQAQQIADTSARLAQQAEQLHHQERLVTERRGEVDRHLGDMREWYRRKMRELAGLDVAEDGNEAPVAVEGSECGILSITGDVEPGDRQLGDLLSSLELIDGDTLTTLLMEARRQRRSLRQLLLAGNYLTLFQMALIEAGNLEGLVLGPVRVIDRLQATPREAVYRVFDPRHNCELMLRHLAESEMEDAVRPDEFLQRFAAAAAVQHENVAATLEVLAIAGRPAALQEWLHGLPSTEWPVLAGAPGVWTRLLSQAASALHAAHSAGLSHGHLHASSFVFTREGVLKLCGLGEPRWLAVPPPQDDDEPSVVRDLAALGHIAAGWAAVAPPAKGGKSKSMPAVLQDILGRFHHEDETQRYANMAELLGDLERATASVPANTAAWERFVRQVREESAASALRESA